MAITLNGSTGITTPAVASSGGDTNATLAASTSVTTPLVTNAGTLALSATGSNVITASTNGAERMRIDTGGAVAIGTSSPIGLITVSGLLGATPVGAFSNFSTSGNVACLTTSLETNGNNTNSYHLRATTQNIANWYLYGNGTSSFSSDERLKKNIETTRDGYIDDLMKLRVVKYNWRTDADGTPKELGLIAQEVEQVFAGLVQDDLNKISENDDTVYKQLKASVLPFMLLKAIQEQQAIITDLKARIETLENK